MLPRAEGGRLSPRGIRAARQITEEEVNKIGELSRHISRAGMVQVEILKARQRVAEARKSAMDAEGELLERMIRNQELARQLRAASGKQALSSAKAAPAAKATPGDPTRLDWEVTDEQVEALALKAVLKFRQLPPAEVKRAWAVWKRELGVRLPPCVAGEVARRAQKLWALSR